MEDTECIWKKKITAYPHGWRWHKRGIGLGREWTDELYPTDPEPF